MKKIFLAIFVIIALASCKNNEQPPVVDSYLIQLDDDKLEFELPIDTEALEDLKIAMQEMNNTIIYLVSTDTSGNNYMFAVSKYTAGEKISADEAFMQAIKTSPQLITDSLDNNFRLEGFKKYEVSGKTLRYKISEHFDNVYTLMFYFMKDDYSDEQYELKISTNKSNLPEALNFLEKVALTVMMH